MVPQTILFGPSDWVPNNSDLPVLFYPSGIESDADLADMFEHRFRANGWMGCWRNGIFSYQHYHTKAHEVLGIAAGTARILLGGPDGQVFEVRAGDCLVLPAGTGHQNIESSADFLVVGAYPPHQNADICTGRADAGDLDTIKALKLPASDPIAGPDGPLIDLWKSR